MDYNTSRNKLVIAEYGRNVQKMVDYAVSLEDRDQRTRLANLIVNVMAQLNPSIREMNDYRQKLWDHLHIISDFRLDVDSPFPVPSPEVLHSKPKILDYQSNGIRFRHYGKHIENIIAKVVELEDGPEKDEYTKMIANQLKRAYLTWNKDSVTDEVIGAHLSELSNGRLTLTDEMNLLRSHDILYKQNMQSNGSKQKKQNPRQGSSSQKSQNYQQGSYFRTKRSKKS